MAIQGSNNVSKIVKFKTYDPHSLIPIIVITFQQQIKFNKIKNNRIRKLYLEEYLAKK